MLKRTLTTILLIPPILYLVGWSPRWLFVVAMAVAVVLALREYFALCRAMGFKVFSLLGYTGAVGMCLAQGISVGDRYPIGYGFVTPWLVAMVLIICTVAMPGRTDLKDYLAATSATIFGIIYIGFSLSCLIPIRFGVLIGVRDAWDYPTFGGPMYVLLLFVVIWAGDICAYLVGRPFGHTPFFARISPRKTWEGALAGLAGSLLAAWGFQHWLWKAAEVKTVILVAAWIAVAGQVGDLVESAIKRGANQKDSGTLLPGHGGFLDRIDSLIFAAPALWLALTVLGSFQ